MCTLCKQFNSCLQTVTASQNEKAAELQAIIKGQLSKENNYKLTCKAISGKISACARLSDSFNCLVKSIASLQ